jgi:hypothetical protein
VSDTVSSAAGRGVYHLRVIACIGCEESRASGRVTCGRSGKTLDAHGRGEACPLGKFEAGVGMPGTLPPVVLPLQEIPADYVPTPDNATRGRCCS